MEKNNVFLRFDLRGHFEVILGQWKYFQTILPFTVKDLFQARPGICTFFKTYKKVLRLRCTEMVFVLHLDSNQVQNLGTYLQFHYNSSEDNFQT